jgi:hypothetical protein
MQENPGLVIALAQARLGRRVFPLAPGGKNPLVKWKEGATDDIGQIKTWWYKWPDAGVAWAIPEGQVVLDIDDPVTAYNARKGFVTARFQITPHGAHFLYTVDPAHPPKQGPTAGGDLKVGGKGYVRLYSADAFTARGFLIAPET